MVKIHFSQKVLKKWSSFRKKLLYFFPLKGGEGGPGPFMEFSIIFFIFFLNPSLNQGVNNIHTSESVFFCCEMVIRICLIRKGC